ncbi:ferredoxin (plasmid) [Rhizobium leguminosarum bv. trifolii WSM2304]|uniref:Ferredoxin n=1 Tax=Rhizobium leguminosarum bv. trifolii (strain WSM2304) TaxID=395492 RepID=A0ABF7QZL9_RHILW|nr:PDR/VanB family oxidoreductase [Rhizobium leguminosarum]ACI59703.1 ferredoxin [Rhizobium leguminosarum bv. trifolii WSM2304]
MSENGSFDLRVVETRFKAEDVVELVLARSDGAPLPRWRPGSHISLKLRDGLERQYSLCGRVDDMATWRIAVLRARESRGGSAHIHDDVKSGAFLRSTGLRNHFPLEKAEGYVFIAGGIGITPMLAMIDQAEAQGTSWVLYYGGRSRASMAYLAELKAYGDRVVVVPEDQRGMLDLRGIAAGVKPGHHVYACGPEGLLTALVTLSEAWPAGTLHLERFSPIEVDSSGDKPFTVHLNASGKSIVVGANETILDAMAREGMQPQSSCREGTCGTCETRVLRGKVDHRDTVLTASEREAGDYMMICVSRAAGDDIEIDA